MRTTTLISTADAAERAGVSRRLVQRLIAQGRLPVHRIGSVAGIDPAGLRLLLKRNRKRGPVAHLDK